MLSIIKNTGCEVISAGILSAFFAQVLKFIIFTTTGGMPSSHSAGVMAVSTAVGILEGFSSVMFAVAIGYSLVTMYDATGVRRAAGKTAACLNRMMDDFYNHDVQAIGGKLKELLGHTPLEVIMGAIFGIVFAYCYHNYFLN